MPFFIVNVLSVIAPAALGDEKGSLPANHCRLQFIENFSVMERVYTVLTWVGHLNSCLNPLIYSRFSREFRRAFHEILCRRKRRNAMKQGLSSALQVLDVGVYIKAQQFLQAPLGVAMGQIAAMYGYRGPLPNQGRDQQSIQESVFKSANKVLQWCKVLQMH